ncbi:MAG: ABC transporter ATP-binding protein, partial [Tidjanibacter sp.]|nr:ABC transporter ATP-binding protein [Tidjanibacter sp.]
EGNGKIKDFPGSYSQYIEWRTLKKEMEAEERAAAATKQVATPKQPRKTTDRPQKLTFKEKKELENLETEMEQLNTEKRTLEEALNSGTLDNKTLTENSIRISEIIELLEEKELRWLELSEKEQ